MKRKIMSTVLASLMVLSSVPISSLPVFATNDSSDITVSNTSDDIQLTESDDGIDISSEDSGISIDDSTNESTNNSTDNSTKSSSDDITVAETETNTEDTADIKIEDYLTSYAEYKDAKKSLDTGDAAKVHVKAENKSEQDASLKLYFCNTDAELSEDKTQWSSYLKNPALEMAIKGLKKDGTLEVSVVDKDKNETKATLKFLKEVKDNKVLSRYAVVTLPAGASTEFDVSVTDSVAGTVSVIPVMEQTGTEYGDAATIEWEENITFLDKVVNFFTKSSDKSADIQISDVQGVEKGVDDVSDSDFASTRLVVMSDKDSVFTDKDTVIGHYGNIYLLQYDSVANTKEAYTRLKGNVTAVEPDKDVTAASNEVTATLLTETAEDETSEAVTESTEAETESKSDSTEVETETESKTDITVSENTDNAIAGLNDMEELKDVQKAKGVIALIDTGVSESDNVINRVSMIDDVLEGNGHGDKMLADIVSQDADAKVLSIRALGDDGLGTVSELVAAMEYAIEQKVDYINLSLYTKATLATSVLEQEITKATDAGIVVIGAAGNDGADVKDYIPGSIENAYIIGSAKDDGTRQEKSNFGSTVDYNVKATTTSDATALFTGYISANGLDKVSDVLNQGLIYATDYKGDDIKVNEPDNSDIPDEECNINVSITDKESGKVTQYELTDKNDYTLTWDATTSHVTAQTSSQQWMITKVSVKDADGKDVVKPEVQDNIRNVFFDMDATGKVTMKIFVKQNKSGVPILDEVSGVTYYESLLCGDNCLEDHVRHPETGDCVDTEEHIDLNNMSESEEKAVKAAAYGTVNDGYKIPSGTYEGSATCVYNGAQWDGVGPCTVTFTSGLLNGFAVPGFECNRHGAANPGTSHYGGGGGVGTYTATVVNAANGVVIFNIHYMPNDYAYGYQDEMKYCVDFNYEYKPPITYTKLTVSKNWNDKNNKYGTRPDCVHITLYRDDEAYSDCWLSDENGWKYTWSDMVKEENNHKYSYRIEEDEVEGYTLEYDMTDPVVGGFHGVSNGYAASVTNTVNLGYLKLHKSSSLPNITDGNSCYNLSGAEYTVYNDEACTEVATYTGSLITDKYGYTDVVELKPGDYWVKETKTTDDGSYEKDEEAHYVSVTADNTTDNPALLEVTDVPGNDPASITITKQQDGEKTETIPTLEGTQFTVRYYDTMNKNDIKSMTPKKTWILDVKYNDKKDRYQTGLDYYYLASNSDSLYTTKDPVTGKDIALLPYGTYTIEESKAAEGYTKKGDFFDDNGYRYDADSVYVTQVTKDSGSIKLNGGNIYESHDTPKSSHIKVKKCKEDGKTPLAGVTYTLADYSGNIVAKKTTGSDGVVDFTDLYPDIYTITEVKTPNGYNLLSEPIVVECPMRMSYGDITSLGIDKNKVTYDTADDIYYVFDQTYNVTNDVTFEVPMTGGVFTPKMLIPLGAGLAIMTCALYITLRKKRRV